SSASAANSGAINSANQRAERSKDRATATRLFVHQERVCAADEFVDVCNFFAAIADTCYFLDLAQLARFDADARVRVPNVFGAGRRPAEDQGSGANALPDVTGQRWRRDSRLE